MFIFLFSPEENVRHIYIYATLYVQVSVKSLGNEFLAGGLFLFIFFVCVLLQGDGSFIEEEMWNGLYKGHAYSITCVLEVRAESLYITAPA